MLLVTCNLLVHKSQLGCTMPCLECNTLCNAKWQGQHQVRYQEHELFQINSFAQGETKSN